MAATVPRDDVLRYVSESEDFSPSTRKQYRDHLIRIFSVLAKDGIDPLTVSAVGIPDYLNEYALRVQPRTYNARLGAVRGFYEWLRSNGVRADNPIEGFPRLPQPPAPRDALTVLELRGLLLVCKSPRERAVISLLGIHALTIEDVVSLRVTDYRRDSEPHALRLPRRSSSAEIRLTRLASEALSGCVDGRARGPLIRNRNNEALTSGNIRTTVEGVAARAEIERRVTPAMLTHSLRQNGWSAGSV